MEFKVPEGIKGLIFDLDGTLADTMPYHMKAWQEACRSYGMDMSSEFLRSFTGSPGKIIATALLEKYGKAGDINPEDISVKKKEMFRSMQHMVKEVKPVADIARHYRNVLSMAVGTGGPRDTVINTLDIIGMKEYFEVVVTADDVENHKPHPETFLKCAEQMGIEAGNIMVFEDGDFGISAAREAGMHPVDVRGWYEYSW